MAAPLVKEDVRAAVVVVVENADAACGQFDLMELAGGAVVHFELSDRTSRLRRRIEWTAASRPDPQPLHTATRSR